jgi:hypothetical protein
MNPALYRPKNLISAGRRLDRDNALHRRAGAACVELSPQAEAGEAKANLAGWAQHASPVTARYGFGRSGEEAVEQKQLTPDPSAGGDRCAEEGGNAESGEPRKRIWWYIKHAVMLAEPGIVWL